MSALGEHPELLALLVAAEELIRQGVTIREPATADAFAVPLADVHTLRGVVDQVRAALQERPGAAQDGPGSPAPVPGPETPAGQPPLILSPEELLAAAAAAGLHLIKPAEPHEPPIRWCAVHAEGTPKRWRWCGHAHVVRDRASDCARDLYRRTHQPWGVVRSYRPKKRTGRRWAEVAKAGAA